ncbi:MAG: LLM class F420-dependent oxidoreductase [Actinomycetota bacterium]
MELGVHVGHWQGDPVDVVPVAREAEALGYLSIWASEAWGSDAATILAWIAAHTRRIDVGAGVFQMPARTPAMTAMTAATLDHLSNGRFRLGLGTTGPGVSEGWHGAAFEDPLGRTREYVQLVRTMLRRDEPVRFDGRHYRLPARGGTGSGLALKLGVRPLRADVPIYLGAMGERNVALTAEIADGWMPLLFSPDRADVFAPALEAGFERRGGRPERFDVAPMVWVALGNDLEACRNVVRPQVALYVGGMGPRKRNFYNNVVARMGFEDAAVRVAEAYLDGRKAEATAAVPDDLVDEVALVGSVGRVRERLAAWREAGVTMIVARTTDVDQLRALADAHGGGGGD